MRSTSQPSGASGAKEQRKLFETFAARLFCTRWVKKSRASGFHTVLDLAKNALETISFEDFWTILAHNASLREENPSVGRGGRSGGDQQDLPYFFVVSRTGKKKDEHEYR